MSKPRSTVAIIGASNNRSKFGNKAVRAYQHQGWEIYPVHPTLSEVEGLRAYPSLDAVPERYLDRVLFYVPPQIGVGLLDQIPGKQVGEVWINPGAESPELLKRAEELGLNVIQACAMVDVGESPGQY